MEANYNLVIKSRFTSVQQRADLCHALWNGYQVLQRPCPTLSHEEGVAAAVEEHTGERGNRSRLLLVLRDALCWKILLSHLFQFTLGGFEQLQSIKVCKREELGLPPLPEDSIRVIRSMRAASPPASASDLIEQQQKRARREHKVDTAAALKTDFKLTHVDQRFPNRLFKGSLLISR